MSGVQKRTFSLAGPLVLLLGAGVGLTCGLPASVETELRSSALVQPSGTGVGFEWSIFYPNQSPVLAAQGAEDVVAAIGPQGAPAACTGGAMVATYGGQGTVAWPGTGTGTALQNLARATIPQLSPPTAIAAGQIPEPQPQNSFRSVTTCNRFYSSPNGDDVRSPENRSFTDAEVARVGQTTFLHFSGATAPDFYFNPGCLFNWLPKPPGPVVPNSHGYYVDFFRTSSDCGATWPGTPGSDGSMPYTKFEWIDTSINVDWNFDQQHIYVDPFNTPGGGPNVYVHGVVAAGFVGSTQIGARGVVTSTNGGATFPLTTKHYIGDKGLLNNDGYTDGGSMTSTSDGTLFYAGSTCPSGTIADCDVRLYTSQNGWQTYTMQLINAPGNPNGFPRCGVMNPWPANAWQGNPEPTAISVSRIAYSSLKPNLARVRLAYPAVVMGGTRQEYVVLEADVPRIGATGTSSLSPIWTFGGTTANSVLEAGFVEPDPFDTPRGGNSATTTDLPDTAVFWSVEADHSGPSLQIRYRLWDGASSFTSAYDLSPVNWAYNSQSWVGDYNKSTYYYDSIAQRNNYLLVWPQGENGYPTLSSTVAPHYNTVSVRPVPDATTVSPHVEELNFGSTVTSGPAVSSQGFRALDIFWVDQNGKLVEKSYNNGWVGGLTTIDGLPASAGGINGDPAAVSWAAGRNDVVVRGKDNKIYQVWRQGGGWNWTPWPLMPDTVTSNPAIASMGVNKLHIFAQFPNGSVRYFRYNSGWDTSWTDLGGVTNSDPVAVADSNSIHLFARGGANCIYHKWSNDGMTWFPAQQTWEADCGGLAATTAPAVAEWSTGRYDLFAGNADPAGKNTLMHLAYENGWQAEWGDLQTDRNGIVLASNPDAVSWGAQRFDVFAKALDGKLWHTWYSMQ